MAASTWDILWKGILEDLFEDFLRFFYPGADQLFDMRKGFGFLDKELEEMSPGVTVKHPLFVDKLVKVFTLSGDEEWILVHIEVQGYTDKLFPQRMFSYFYRIRDKYGKEVTAIAIFTDDDVNYHPDCYEYHFQGTSLTYRFKTYKINHQDAAELEKSNNPFAAVILTVLIAMQRGKKQPEELLNLTTELVKTLFRKGYPKEKIDRLLVFIKQYVHFGRPEEFAKFEIETDIINQKTRTMGIKELVLQLAREEGLEKGLEEGNDQAKRTFVTNLITQTDFSIQKIAQLADADIGLVIEIKGNLAGS